MPVSYGCKARRLREAPLPLSLDAGESRLYADQQRCVAAAAAAHGAFQSLEWPCGSASTGHEVSLFLSIRDFH